MTRRKPSELLWLFGAAALALLIAGLVRVAVYGPVEIPAQVPVGAETPAPAPTGELVMLRMEGRKSVGMVVDPRAVAAAIEGGSAGLNLFDEGKVVLVKVPVRAMLYAVDGEYGAVRVLDGEHAGQLGIVNMNCVER